MGWNTPKGTGFAQYTMTNGIKGSWTPNPTQWDVPTSKTCSSSNGIGRAVLRAHSKGRQSIPMPQKLLMCLSRAR